jgi:ribonuclease-3
MKMDMNEQKKYPIYNINNKLINIDFINSTINEYIENYDLKGLKCNRSDLKIKNIDLWQRAFTHKSYSKYAQTKKKSSSVSSLSSSSDEEDNEKINSVQIQNNCSERLEFLGDAVLQFVVSNYLFKRYPKQFEGFLTTTRSKIVKTQSLYTFAKNLGFERPEHKLKGINVCECFIVNLLEAGIIDISKLIITNDNYKDQLMRYYQKNFGGAYPIYRIENPEECKAKKIFVMYVTDQEGKKIGFGEAKNKKEAEQKAAKQALEHFNVMNI